MKDEKLIRRARYLIKTVFGATSETECWTWNNRPQLTTRDDKGNVVNVSLRRAVYEAFIGPIPQFHEVRNTCGSRKCVNPKHLETRISVREVCKLADAADEVQS